MKFRLQNEIINAIPGLQIGLIVLKNLQNSRKNSTIEQLLRGLGAEKKRQFKDEKKKAELEAFLFKAHLDKKVLTEAQFLEESMKTAANGKDLPFKNNLDGLRLYIGLRNNFPSGLCDLDQLEKDLEINFAEPKPKPSLKPVTSSETIQAAMWFINLGSSTKEDFESIINESVKIIQKYSQTQEMAIYFLGAELQEVDLEYVSEKEKLYLEEQQKIEQQKREEEARKQEEARIEAEKAAELEAKREEEEEKTAQQQKEKVAQKLVTSNYNSSSPRIKLQNILNETVDQYLKNQASTSQNIEQPLTTQEPTLSEKFSYEPAQVMLPTQKGHGDYTSNIAMQLSKKLNKNPQEVAKEIIALLPPIDFIEKVELAGPGFINFTLSQKYLEQEIENIVNQKEQYGSSHLGKGQKALIEYSQPNIAKPLGAHHLLSTIIGQILVNLHRFEGFEVIATNYPGDWGTQFGKLIYAYKTWGNEETVKKDPLNELLKLYVHFHNEAEKDPTLDDKGRAEFKKLEEGDEENHKLWQWMKDLSIQEIERLYKKLDVTFDVYLGEEMHREQAQKLIEEGRAKGFIEEGEKGALIIKFENDKLPPYMVQKADGTTLYSSRDIASIHYRLEKFQPAKIVYVVDVAQSLHFQQLFESVKKFGFTGAELVHVAFGRMQFPDGKMSTRKGEIILMDEMIKEAEERSQKIVEEKSRDLTAEEKKTIVEGMAVSALKYNVLSQNRESNYTFQWDKILSLEGNSAPYLQYAYARSQNILKKAEDQQTAVTENKTSGPSTLQLSGKNTPVQTSLLETENRNDLQQPLVEEKSLPVQTSDGAATASQSHTPFSHPAEQKLLHLFPLFSEYVEQATLEYKPNILCSYLFELARAFSGFYNEVPVVNAPTQELKTSRLQLVQAFGQIMENGLHLLGIATFKKM